LRVLFKEKKRALLRDVEKKNVARKGTNFKVKSGAGGLLRYPLLQGGGTKRKKTVRGCSVYSDLYQLDGEER